MSEPNTHESLTAVITLEAHRFVDDAMEETMRRISTLPAARPERASSSPPFGAALPIPPSARVAMAAAIDELRLGTTLPYPPTAEARLSDEELAAIAELRDRPHALSAIRKLVRSGSAATLFHLFCLLDAVGDPAITERSPWLPIKFARGDDDDASGLMVHDEFTEVFHRYAALRRASTGAA